LCHSPCQTYRPPTNYSRIWITSFRNKLSPRRFRTTKLNSLMEAFLTCATPAASSMNTCCTICRGANPGRMKCLATLSGTIFWTARPSLRFPHLTLPIQSCTTLICTRSNARLACTVAAGRGYLPLFLRETGTD
jgi:hypothetical protein